MNNHELTHATDGALRVARRQSLQARDLMCKVSDRLEVLEHGDKTEEGVYHKSQGAAAQTDQLAEIIERELDERGADYTPRSEL